MKMLYFFVVSVFSALLVSVHSFVSTPFSLISKNTRLFADVEVIFPNGKKFKGAAGTPLKEAAKKAGFSPNYGCEEGKCGSCELKFAGKKIRPCTGKVPASATPIKLENP